MCHPISWLVMYGHTYGHSATSTCMHGTQGVDGCCAGLRWCSRALRALRQRNASSCLHLPLLLPVN